MQQQLDAQMALSRTLTESLTGMLEQVSATARYVYPWTPAPWKARYIRA